MTQRIRRVSLSLAIGWMATIFFLSSQPNLPTPYLFHNQDKLFHFAAYGVLGVLLLMSFRYKIPGYTGLQITMAVVLASLYGISDEIHQTFVPGRDAEVLDWAADTLGALTAVLILALIVKKTGLRDYFVATGQSGK